MNRFLMPKLKIIDTIIKILLHRFYALHFVVDKILTTVLYIKRWSRTKRLNDVRLRVVI